MKRKQAWKLPIVFLVGYLFAWGSILLDRQMIIDEQRRLQDEVERTRIELKITKMRNHQITKMIDEYGDDYEEMVIWNEEAVESKEMGK